MRGQSSSAFVPSVIKTNVLLNDDHPAQKEFILQRYGERIEKLSQQDRLSKFCTDAGSLTTVEVGRCFVTGDTEEFSQFTDSVACREYTLPRDEEHLNRKVGFERTPRLDPYWKLQLVAYKENMEWKSELNLLTKTILTHGSEYLMAWISWSQTWTIMSRKPQKCSSKDIRWNWMQVILQADQRPKQNHKNEILPAYPQELYLLGRELGLMLNQENIRSPIIKCRINWSIFFVTEIYLETKMEQLNSGE